MDNLTLTNKSAAAVNLTLSPHSPGWNFDSIFNIIVSVVAVFLNMAVLITILRDRVLRTAPFSVYQVNLMIANLLYIIIHEPMFLISTVDGVWWMGEFLCNLYEYAMHIIFPTTNYTHLLITLNRLWAMVFPFSYRTKHTLRVAVALCIGMWVYVNAMLLPRSVMDGLWFRLPPDMYGCNLRFGPYWRTLSIIFQFFFYNMPAIVILSLYPYIFYKHRKTQAVSNANAVNGTNPSHTAQTNATVPADDANAPKVPAAGKIDKKNRGFLVLSCLTLSVLVCWVPYLTYYSIRHFITTFDFPLLLKVADSLYNLQVLLDPIILVSAQRSLRSIFYQKMSCCFRWRM